MTRSVELSALDLRYESYRMRNPAVEARLLASIAERGIEEALEGVDAAGGSILLNGFKRYRCASKLRIRMAPFASLGRSEEHTSELQSRFDLVCRLLLEKKKRVTVLRLSREPRSAPCRASNTSYASNDDGSLLALIASRRSIAPMVPPAARVPAALPVAP